VPEEFSIRKGKDGKWFLHNKTQTRERRPDLPSSKPSYKEISIDKVNPTDDRQAMMPKLDGAHTIIDLKAGRAPRAFSYRVGKKAPTGLIEHTHKMPELLKTKVPKELDRTILRAETLGLDEKGKPLSAEVLGGLLNRKVWESRKEQSRLKARLKAFPFGVVQYKGRNMENAPFDQKLEVLKKVENLIDELEMPELATTPANKIQMLNAIRSGSHPLTREGVVLVDRDRDVATIKAKLVNDYDVFVRGIQPNREHPDRAGSFTYSWTPNGPLAKKQTGEPATVGSGLKHDMARDMLRNPDDYIGRVAKVKAPKVFTKGDTLEAMFQPRFKEWHLDKGDIEKSAAYERMKTLNAKDIEPLHGVTNQKLMSSLKRSMKRKGWIGDPVVVLDGKVPKGVSGSHRVAAASELGMKIPALVIGPRPELKMWKNKSDADVIERMKKFNLPRATRLMERQLPTEKLAFIGRLREAYQHADKPQALAMALGIPIAGLALGHLGSKALMESMEPSEAVYKLKDLKRALKARGIPVKDEPDPKKSIYKFKTKTVHAPKKKSPEFMAHELEHAKLRKDYPRLGTAVNIARRLAPATGFVVQSQLPPGAGLLAAAAGSVPTFADEAYASLRAYKALKESGKYTPEQLEKMRKNLIKGFGNYGVGTASTALPLAVVSSMVKGASIKGFGERLLGRNVQQAISAGEGRVLSHPIVQREMQWGEKPIRSYVSEVLKGTREHIHPKTQGKVVPYNPANPYETTSQELSNLLQSARADVVKQQSATRKARLMAAGAGTVAVGAPTAGIMAKEGAETDSKLKQVAPAAAGTAIGVTPIVKGISSGALQLRPSKTRGPRMTFEQLQRSMRPGDVLMTGAEGAGTPFHYTLAGGDPRAFHAEVAKEVKPGGEYRSVHSLGGKKRGGQAVTQWTHVKPEAHYIIRRVKDPALRKQLLEGVQDIATKEEALHRAFGPHARSTQYQKPLQISSAFRNILPGFLRNLLPEVRCSGGICSTLPSEAAPTLVPGVKPKEVLPHHLLAAPTMETVGHFTPELTKAQRLSLALKGAAPWALRGGIGLGLGYGAYRGAKKLMEDEKPPVKEAGVREALYTALTGRVPLQHGTSKTISREIARTGIKPQGSRGISDVFDLSEAEKGLAFLTRNPAESKLFAHQAEGLRRVQLLRSLLKKRVPTVSKEIEGVLQEAPKVEKGLAMLAGMVPGGKKIVRANIPRQTLKAREGTIPELTENPLIEISRQMHSKVHPQMEQAVALPFKSVVSVKGGVPAKYVKGSPSYQRPTFSEMRANLRSAAKDPKEYGKDVLRSLTGVSHRPSTILKRNPL